MEELGFMIMLGVMFVGGLIVGLNSHGITELENECIVYENNVYCKEVTE